MENRVLAEILEKINDIRRTAPLVNDAMDSVVRLIKGELDRKKARQTGPAIGQQYWFTRISNTDAFAYDADYFDLNVFKFRGGYPEERFAEAELKAMRLIVGVNKRRRELNEGEELGARKYHIVYLSNSELGMRETSKSSYALDYAFPFGLFKNSVDCETCIREFEDELKWFYEEYLPLMEELDDYDWAEAPGWGDVHEAT